MKLENIPSRWLAARCGEYEAREVSPSDARRAAEADWVEMERRRIAAEQRKR